MGDVGGLREVPRALGERMKYGDGSFNISILAIVRLDVQVWFAGLARQDETDGHGDAGVALPSNPASRMR